MAQVIAETEPPGDVQDAASELSPAPGTEPVLDAASERGPDATLAEPSAGEVDCGLAANKPALQGGFRLVSCLRGPAADPTRSDGFGSQLMARDGKLMLLGDGLRIFERHGDSLQQVGPALRGLAPHGGLGHFDYDAERRLLAVGLPSTTRVDAQGKQLQAVGMVQLYEHTPAGGLTLLAELTPRDDQGAEELIEATAFGSSLAFTRGDLVVSRATGNTA